MGLQRILSLVYRERYRQEDLKAAGRFKYTCADPEISDDECMVVLIEEIGEVARQVLNQPDREGERSYDGEGSREGLQKELIQVAAVAVAWAERLA